MTLVKKYLLCFNKYLLCYLKMMMTGIAKCLWNVFLQQQSWDVKTACKPFKTFLVINKYKSRNDWEKTHNFL